MRHKSRVDQSHKTRGPRTRVTISSSGIATVLGMAKSATSRKKKSVADAPRPVGRVRIVLLGALLGAVWGALMWCIMVILGQTSGLSSFIYAVVTVAMIGIGVAAFFGAIGIHRRGERVSPRIRRRDRSA